MATSSGHRRVIIIGAGPAGFTAAIYAARANLSPLMFEGSGGGQGTGQINLPGGQLMITTEVDNYPGFEHGILGPELMMNMRAQALRFETEILTRDVTKVDFSGKPLRLWSENDEYTADAVIITTGASAKLLGLPSEATLMGYGVSACATCDGFFFKDREVVVVGGGDTAVEEAAFLTKYCSKVTLIHRRKELRASKIMQSRAFANPKIEFLWDTAVTEVIGDRDSGVTGLKLRNVRTDEVAEFKCDGLFVAIGHNPNTSLFTGQLEMNEAGYLVTRPGTTYTSIPGVFAAGDVQDFTYRQAVTAAGSGCMAAIDAERWLEEQTHRE